MVNQKVKAAGVADVQTGPTRRNRPDEDQAVEGAPVTKRSKGDPTKSASQVQHPNNTTRVPSGETVSEDKRVKAPVKDDSGLSSISENDDKNDKEDSPTSPSSRVPVSEEKRVKAPVKDDSGLRSISDNDDKNDKQDAPTSTSSSAPVSEEKNVKAPVNDDSGLRSISENDDKNKEAPVSTSSSVSNETRLLSQAIDDRNVSREEGVPSALSLSRSSGATFASIFPKKEKKNQVEGPFLEDFDVLRVTSLPSQCQVTKDSLQDECLAGGYKDLSPLEWGEFISWKPSAIGGGHPFFSRFWPESVPEMRIWNCIDAIQFVHHGRFINPSRASPLEVNARRMSADGRNLRLYVDAVHSICISSICVTDSYLHAPPASGLPQKQLRGVLHTQEWERLTAFFCMVFFKPELHAQLYKDALAFVTKAADFPSKQGSTMFKQSYATKQKPIANSFVLEFEESVPVYDARNFDFNISEDINKIKEKLPLFEGEVPRGSFAVVAYTAACYHSSKDGLWHFSGNIQWAIVMGVPSG